MCPINILIVIVVVLLVVIIYYLYTRESFTGTDADTKKKEMENIVNSKVNTVLSFMRGAIKGSDDVYSTKIQSIEAAKQAVETSLMASETKVTDLITERDQLRAKVDILEQNGITSGDNLAQLNAEIIAIESTINLLVTAINDYKLASTSISCKGSPDNIIDNVVLDKPDCWAKCYDDHNCAYATHNSDSNSCTTNKGRPFKCTFEPEDSMYISDMHYTIETDTDYSGNHMFKEAVADVPSCAKLCRQTTGCKVGVYDNNNSDCWLQSGLDNKKSVTGLTSVYV